jgi:hypothetical protein
LHFDDGLVQPMNLLPPHNQKSGVVILPMNLQVNGAILKPSQAGKFYQKQLKKVMKTLTPLGWLPSSTRLDTAISARCRSRMIFAVITSMCLSASI